MSNAWFDRIAHDLKGPLAPLQTAAFLLKSDALPPERQRELVTLIERQTRRLDRMIGEFGDWSRASRNALVARRAPCELALVLDLAIGSVPGCQSVARVAPGLERAHVEGDEGRLTQLFGTLLAHAGWRDPTRSPDVTVEPAGDAAVCIGVEDHGPALAPDVLATLLGEPSAVPFDEGLGLRLPIAAAIAAAHGGSLRAEPVTPGFGLRLLCTLPLAA